MLESEERDLQSNGKEKVEMVFRDKEALLTENLNAIETQAQQRSLDEKVS